MEELRTALGAMKTAEEALAKQGFILRWTYKVKVDRGFVRNAIKRLLTDTTIPEKTSVPRDTPKPRAARKQKGNTEKNPLAEQTASAVAAQEEAIPEIKETRPVTAFDIKASASYLGISYAGVFDLIKRGRLPAHGEVGKRWLLPEDLDQYLASRKKPVVF